MEPSLVGSVIQDDVEASGHGDQKFMQFLVGMPSTLSSSRHIVQIVHSLNVVRDVPSAFNERQVASRVSDLWQINQFAVS